MVDDSTDVDEIVAELVAAGLVSVGTDDDGQETWTLTAMGEQVARQMAMSSEADAAALLDALLDGTGRPGA
jgi:DNA-binding MarR family transcriptional regulator